jgi:translocation and assembly module TamB
MEFEPSGGVEGVKRSAFLPTAILQESAAPILMDLDISFPRGIEVKNRLVDGKADGKLNIQGPPGKPVIIGAVTAEKDTKVSFRESVVFEVLTGTATFDDPTDANPRIYLSARTRLETPQQDYDINLVVQGRAKDPKVSLSSQPPRAEKDIISLLALGTDTSTSDAVASSTAVRTGLSSGTQVAGTGATVGATLLTKPINNEIKSKTGFDVALTSSFDDSTNATVPKVIASRQFTPTFGISASRSFGQEPKTDAKVRYRLSKQLSAIGSWEGLDRTDTGGQVLQQQQQDTSTLNKVGLDLEYKFEFK